MAEWVLKGSVKGPQGDPGQDASLPSGGTEGQFLQKTADGEQWAGAVTATDMSDSGVTMYQLNTDGSTPINGLVFLDDDGHNASTTGVISSFTSDSGTGSTIQLGSGLRSNGVPDAQSVIALTSGAVDGRCASFLSFVAAGADAEKISSIELSVVEGMDTEFKIDDKTVNGFTDTIESNAEGSLLPTDKAVKDYVTSVTATDEEFDTFMGLS